MAIVGCSWCLGYSQSTHHQGAYQEVLEGNYFAYSYLTRSLPCIGHYRQCVRKVAVHLGYGRVQLNCDSTRWRTGSGLYRRSWTSLPTPFITVQRLSELPLPCVTVCHHISTGLYRSLSAQRLSERTVYIYKLSRTLYQLFSAKVDIAVTTQACFSLTLIAAVSCS